MNKKHYDEFAKYMVSEIQQKILYNNQKVLQQMQVMFQLPIIR